MAWMCVQEAKKKMSRSVLKYLALIKCEDDSIYQDKDKCLEDKFSGKVCKFSLGNEFQVAVSHPSGLKKAVGSLGLKTKFGYCVNWSANTFGSY